MNKTPFITVQFPDGSAFMIRTDISGVILDEAFRPIDEELALNMLIVKSRKLAAREIFGRA